MQRPKAIQLDITTPCHEDWNKMSACGEGRHCAHCNKTVIDFTTWSDTALYEFFAKDRGNVCGRLNVWQMNRPIHIPPQPYSRLYRMVMAMGLTLVFAQGTDVYAQSRPPMVQQTETKVVAPNRQIYEIAGIVLDERKEPVIGATVQVTQNGVVKGSTQTDYDGNYIVKPLAYGTYEVSVTYESRCRMRVTGIVMDENRLRVTQNIWFDGADTITVKKYKRSLVEQPVKAIGMPIEDRFWNSQPYQRMGGISSGYKAPGARKTGTLYIVDGVDVPEAPKDVAFPAKKDSLLNPNHKVYNKDDVQNMNIR